MMNDFISVAEEIKEFVDGADLHPRLSLALLDVRSDILELEQVIQTIGTFADKEITEKDLICALNVYKSNRGKLLKED